MAYHAWQDSITRGKTLLIGVIGVVIRVLLSAAVVGLVMVTQRSSVDVLSRQSPLTSRLAHLATVSEVN